MPDAILVLQLEHRKIASVLTFLRQQLTEIERDEPANRHLLESALDYLSGYPDQCHHPKEDLVYRKLVARFPELTESLKDLGKEHEELAYRTRSLRQAIREWQQDSPTEIETPVDQLRAFVDYYRLHMRVEEQVFFPMALQRLSRDDFAEIDFALYEQLNQSLDREAEARYGELLAAIVQLGNADKSGTEQREDATRLATFQNIVTFNDAMRRESEPVKLARLSGGGYALEGKGGTIAHIPECSEARAAWCAYFFWKATTMTRATR
jgi:hemerythrin-like domain-containing protein